ncbi:unnamed protein product [Closterium sp. NIES-54]
MSREHSPSVAVAPPPLASVAAAPAPGAAPPAPCVPPPLLSPAAAATAPAAAAVTPPLPSTAAAATSPAAAVVTPPLPSPAMAVTPPLPSPAAAGTPPLLSLGVSTTAPAVAAVTPPLLSLGAVVTPLLSPDALTETAPPATAAAATVAAAAAAAAAAAGVPSQTAPAPPSPNKEDDAHIHLHDLGVVTTFPLDKPVASCTVGTTGVPLATFHREPGSGLLLESLALLLRCVEGWQRAAPHSSSFPPTTAPFQTLHLDVLGPSPVCGPSQERYFLIMVDDYSRYTTVLPLRRKADVPTVLKSWLLARGDAQALCGLRLHSDRGGEFSSTCLETFCQGRGIIQSYTLPNLPQQNEVAERRIGLVMEVARTSMCHAGAPQFLWPQAVCYIVQAGVASLPGLPLL